MLTQDRVKCHSETIGPASAKPASAVLGKPLVRADSLVNAMTNTPESFWSKVAKGDPSQCWEWTGRIETTGYAYISWQGRPRRAHRLAYELTNGRIPDGLVVMHRCDNKRCCNPAHLQLGTQADNIADKVSKHRQATGDAHGSTTHPESVCRGENHGMSKMSEAVVISMLDMRKSGLSTKQISIRLGVSKNCIMSVVMGRTWTRAAKRWTESNGPITRIYHGLCTIPECTGKHYGNRLCYQHYKQNHRVKEIASAA